MRVARRPTRVGVRRFLVVDNLDPWMTSRPEFFFPNLAEPFRLLDPDRPG